MYFFDLPQLEQIMMTDPKPPRPSYDEVEACLGGALALISPAELHGLLLGTFCAMGTDLPEQIALAACFAEDSALNISQQQVLHALLVNTRDDLIDFNFAIHLLLPDENDDTSKLASEFITWCQGFLSGLGSANEQAMHDEDAIDAIKRIVEAANINLTELDISQEDEAYLIDVIEYVRLAVLTIYADLKKGHHSDSGSKTSYH